MKPDEKEQADAGKAAERKARFKSAMKDALDRVQRLGSGAVELLKRLRKDKSPEAMLKTLEASLDANRARREDAAKRVETLHGQITRKKAEFAKAAPARKRVLEAELASLLADYKTSERQLTILLENERTLSQVKGRLNEITAYGMAGVSEESIDDLIDDVEERVQEAEARVDSARDLEKAGRRRDRSGDRDNLWDELAAFDEETGGGAPEAPEKSDTERVEKPGKEPRMDADRQE